MVGQRFRLLSRNFRRPKTRQFIYGGERGSFLWASTDLEPVADITKLETGGVENRAAALPDRIYLYVTRSCTTRCNAQKGILSLFLSVISTPSFGFGIPASGTLDHSIIVNAATSNGDWDNLAAFGIAVDKSGSTVSTGHAQDMTVAALDPPSGSNASAHSVIAGPDVTAVSATDDPSPAELARLLNLPDRPPMPVVDNIDMSQGLGVVFADLDSLQDQIAGMQRPVVAALFRYSNQSDHLDIRQEEGSSDLYFNNGLTRIGLSGQAINYSPSSGPAINQYAAGLTGHQQIGNYTSVTGEAYLNRIASHSLDYYRVTYDAYLTLKPSDYFRIDLDSNRRMFDNITSLRLGAVAQSFGGSVDYLPNSGLRLTARAAHSSFNDGNQRRTEELEGLLRVANGPLIEIGIRGTNFHFTRLLNDGYFNPRDYTSGEAVFHFNAPISKLLNFDLAGSGGVEKSSPGGTKPVVKVAVKLSYKLTARWSLDTEGSYFSSRTSNSTGFARKSVLLGLSYRL